MKQYKKRTVALVLASVVTVVGAFGAENYKNSLMSLKFDEGSDKSVKMTLLTKQRYDNNININILYVELILLIDNNILKLFIKSKL